MPVYHDKAEIIAQINSMAPRAFDDGVLIDLPRTRRRDQGANPQKQLRLALDGDLKRRMAAQIERFVERFGKGIGWELMLRRLEKPLTEEEECGDSL